MRRMHVRSKVSPIISREKEREREGETQASKKLVVRPSVLRSPFPEATAIMRMKDLVGLAIFFCSPSRKQGCIDPYIFCSRALSTPCAFLSWSRDARAMSQCGLVLIMRPRLSFAANQEPSIGEVGLLRRHRNAAEPPAPTYAFACLRARTWARDRVVFQAADVCLLLCKFSAFVNPNISIPGILTDSRACCTYPRHTFNWGPPGKQVYMPNASIGVGSLISDTCDLTNLRLPLEFGHGRRHVGGIGGCTQYGFVYYYVYPRGKMRGE